MPDFQKMYLIAAGAIADALDELDKLNAKLNNPGFVNKAPAQVVEAEKERAAQLTELVAKLEEQLKGM